MVTRVREISKKKNYLLSMLHVAEKDRDQAWSIGKEWHQVVGELGHGRVDLDHRVPRLHKVEPVVLKERAPQAFEQAELAERCWQG